MELWIDAILIVVVAILIDRFIGDFPNIIHPLRWMGLFIGWIDRKIKNRSSKFTKVKGFLSYLILFLITFNIVIIVSMLVRHYLSDYTFEVFDHVFNIGELVWIVVVAFFFKFTFAIFSFRKHCRPIQKDLEEGRVEDAAAKVQMIVSRNTKGMDPEHIASSCCETISENLVDSACSPTFYFGWLGLLGSFIFRCANMMDAMWGYLNEKYGNLGFFPAKFDDVLGYVTSRISPAFVLLAAKLMRLKNGYPPIAAAREEHTKTPSPNSGWPMTAVSAALGISMEKKDVYVMGKGPMPTPEDITRCYHLVELTSILFMVIITIPLFVFIGIHIQVYIEDLWFNLLGAYI